MPDDNSSLPERSAALIEWCEGFLSGLGIAGVTDFERLSFECRELIHDLYKICRLDVGDMEDTGEDEEAAFVELIEYVRMGTMMLHDEMHNSSVSGIRPEVLH